jgi:outer membrane receptor for ferrienterochelin and colicins
LDTSRYQEWKPKEQYFGTFNYNYSGKFLNIGAKTEYYNEEIQNKGNPVLTPYQAYAFDDYYFTRRLNQSLFVESRLKNNAKILFTNAYDNYRRIDNTYRKDLVTLDQELSTGAGTQDTTTFDEWTMRGTYSSVLPSRKINFQVGYDINLQSGAGVNLVSGIQHLNDYAAFGSFEYQLFKGFNLRPGLRFAYNTDYGAPLTPSLNVKYDFRNRYTLRASYARGFRSPSLKELNLEFVDVNHNIHGNDSLKAETSDNFNLTFTARNKIGPNNLKAEVSFFYNNIRNIITLALIDPSTNYYTYINLDRYKTRGTTFTAEFQMKHAAFYAGFSLLGLYNTLADTFNIEKFSLTPEFQGNFTYTFTKANMDGAIYFKNTGSTPGYSLDAQGNVYQTFLESYSIMDASLTKYFWKKHMALTAGVKNIFNVTDLKSNALGESFHSSDSGAVPYAIGRFFFASLQLKLFKG